MRRAAAMAIAGSALMGCQLPDEAALIYDVSEEKFYVAQWGDYRRLTRCPKGSAESTTTSDKPRLRNTRIAYSTSNPIRIIDKKIGWRKYHRASFYECIEPGKVTQ